MAQALKNPLHRALAVVVSASAGLLASSAVLADPNPYYLGGSLGLNRVSNVYREQGADSNYDTVTTATLLAGVDQQIGRQHLTVDASLQDNRYKINTPLDNHGYSLNANLDWATVDRISGTLTSRSSSSLASYNAGGITQPVFTKNIEKDEMQQAVVRVGLVTRYSLETTLTHTSQDFSAYGYDSLDYSQNSGSLGLVYLPYDGMRLGVALRHSLGEYPRYPEAYFTGVSVVGITVDDHYKRNDLDLTAYWAVSGASKISARLSWTDAKHDLATQLDYRGLTGLLSWTWQPAERWVTTATVSRDTGNQVAISGANLSQVGTSYQINSSYQLTGKIALTAAASIRRSGTTDLSTGNSGYFDNDHSYSLGSTWTYSRSLSFSCQVNRTGRESNVSFYTYNATAYGCNVQGMVY